MDNTQEAEVTGKVITRDEWRRKHKDFRSGDPRKGTATMLYHVPGKGTVLGPVTVLDDNGRPIGPKGVKS